MSLKGRLTGHFLGRVFLLFLVLGLVLGAWVVGVALYMTAINSPDARNGAASPLHTLEHLRDATTVSDTSTVSGANVEIGSKALATVADLNAWVQVLDPQGRVIYSYAAPSTLPTAYPAGKLVYLRNKPKAIGQGSLFTLYDSKKSELTWVLGSKEVWLTPLQGEIPPITQTRAIIGLLVVSFGVVLLIAWASSETLARPLLHAMAWLEAIAGGSYAEPLDRRGQPASREPNGQLRAPYRTYREVIASLDKLTAKLGRNKVERERIETAREEWLTGVTHDLRTPLSSVRGYADLLASDYVFTPEEQRQYAATISSQAEDMERLIDDLGLTFRLRSEALPLSREPVDLVEVAREAAVALANDVRSEGRTITFVGARAGESLPVSVDARYVARALGNLLGNAVVHNAEGTTVMLSAHREAGWACVDIADDGRGMDEATLSRLFDRYYRGTASGGDAYGSGLGMAIARQLIEAHGGTVEVTSAVGEGTSVRVRLPLAV